MWIFRIRSEVTNFCSTELKNWTREPKRWEGLGKGMIAVLAKLPMRNVSIGELYSIYNTCSLICRIASRSLCVCSLVRPVIFKAGAMFQIVIGIYVCVYPLPKGIHNCIKITLYFDGMKSVLYFCIVV